jgi:hypothetical protein
MEGPCWSSPFRTALRAAPELRGPRRFTLEPIAIGAAEAALRSTYVDARAKPRCPAPFYYDQLGSFNRDHIVRHLGGALEPFIVEARSSAACRVLARHAVKELHLHVDVEGYDLEVLKTLDFAAHAPSSMYIEHKHSLGEGRAEMQAYRRELHRPRLRQRFLRRARCEVSRPLREERVRPNTIHPRTVSPWQRSFRNGSTTGPGSKPPSPSSTGIG